MGKAVGEGAGLSSLATYLLLTQAEKQGFHPEQVLCLNSACSLHLFSWYHKSMPTCGAPAAGIQRRGGLRRGLCCGLQEGLSSEEAGDIVRPSPNTFPAVPLLCKRALQAASLASLLRHVSAGSAAPQARLGIC